MAAPGTKSPSLNDRPVAEDPALKDQTAQKTGPGGPDPDGEPACRGFGVVVSDPSHVLLLDGAPALAEALSERLRRRGLTSTRLPLDAALAPGLAATGDLAVVLVDQETASERGKQLRAVVGRLAAEKIGTVVCGAGEGGPDENGPLVEWLPADTSLDEMVGKVSTLARYVPLVRALERELQHLQRLGRQLNRYFGEIDREMRLAGRLQRDFLPRELPQVPPFRFDVFYRPASWVSGDMYDVFPLSEHHLGLFVADAMGHGVAAGLLTMFLRQVLAAARSGSGIDLSPARTLEDLHQCLLRQKLPDAQFVTAAYGILDTRSRRCQIARAGHPYPLHIRPDGSIQQVRCCGGLLGLPDAAGAFEQAEIALEPGDKLLLYTDGLEEALLGPGAGGDSRPGFSPQLLGWARLPAQALVQEIGRYLDQQEGSLHPPDDMTLLVLEVASVR